MRRQLNVPFKHITSMSNYSFKFFPGSSAACLVVRPPRPKTYFSYIFSCGQNCRIKVFDGNDLSPSSSWQCAGRNKHITNVTATCESIKFNVQLEKRFARFNRGFRTRRKGKKTERILGRIYDLLSSEFRLDLRLTRPEEKLLSFSYILINKKGGKVKRFFLIEFIINT